MKISRHSGLIISLLMALLFFGGESLWAKPEPPSKYDRFLDSVVVVRSSTGIGTGFFVAANGLLVSNHHVVGKDSTVSITIRNGKTITGTVLAVSDGLDLALISIPGQSSTFLHFAGANEGGVGSDVIAIGTAKGLSWSVSKGIISGLRDGEPFKITDYDGVQLIQTDAAINQGNSGGPLILLDSGRVIGVNTLSAHKNVAEGISFAISAGDVKQAFASHLGLEPGASSAKPPSKAPSAKDRLKAWMDDPEAAIARLTQKKMEPDTGRQNTVTGKGGTDKVTLHNPEKVSVKNQSAGSLLVITGRAKNTDKTPHGHVRLKGVIHDEQGNPLMTKLVYSGNFLSKDELGHLPMSEIESLLNVPAGLKGANENIQPGHSVTFMVVFDNIPSHAAEWSVVVHSLD